MSRLKSGLHRVIAYLDPKTYERLVERAERDKRSISQTVALLIELALDLTE